MFMATFAVAPEGFALGQALAEVPEMEVEAERIAATSTHWVMPCLWAAGGDFDAFDAALEADPSVEAVVERERFDDEAFYQVVWSDDVVRHVDAALDMEATILHAEVSNGEWHLRVRFVSRDQLEAFRTYLDDEGLGFRLRNLTETTSPRQERGGLTAAQRDALVTAVEDGYFDIPRSTSMARIAEALGISEQAASERIRRGTARLVDHVLTTATDGGRRTRL